MTKAIIAGMKIEYKHIRHGYARIDEEGKLLITIPVRKKDDEGFKHILIEKGKMLLKRFHKRVRIYPIQEDSILLFGEQVPMEDILKSGNLIPAKRAAAGIKPDDKRIHKTLTTILNDYATPLVERYSEKVGKKYAKLSFRRTKSKR